MILDVNRREAKWNKGNINLKHTRNYPIVVNYERKMLPNLFFHRVNIGDKKQQHLIKKQRPLLINNTISVFYILKSMKLIKM